jgi:hypothetical protein
MGARVTFEEYAYFLLDPFQVLWILFGFELLFWIELGSNQKMSGLKLFGSKGCILLFFDSVKSFIVKSTFGMQFADID